MDIYFDNVKTKKGTHGKKTLKKKQVNEIKKGNNSKPMQGI